MSEYTTDKEFELQEALLRFIRVASRNHCVVEGVVMDVNTTQFTCDVQVGDSESSILFSSVSLEVLIGSKSSFTLVPTKGSNVLLVFRDGHQDRPQLLKIDQIDYVYATPNVKWIFNNGENGIPESPKVAEQINISQTDINKLKVLLAAWSPISGDGGASLKTLLTDWFTQLEELTVTEDIASTKIFQ